MKLKGLAKFAKKLGLRGKDRKEKRTKTKKLVEVVELKPDVDQPAETEEDEVTAGSEQSRSASSNADKSNARSKVSATNVEVENDGEQVDVEAEDVEAEDVEAEDVEAEDVEADDESVDDEDDGETVEVTVDDDGSCESKTISSRVVTILSPEGYKEKIASDEVTHEDGDNRTWESLVEDGSGAIWLPDDALMSLVSEGPDDASYESDASPHSASIPMFRCCKNGDGVEIEDDYSESSNSMEQMRLIHDGEMSLVTYETSSVVSMGSMTEESLSRFITKKDGSNRLELVKLKNFLNKEDDPEDGTPRKQRAVRVTGASVASQSRQSRDSRRSKRSKKSSRSSGTKSSTKKTNFLDLSRWMDGQGCACVSPLDTIIESRDGRRTEPATRSKSELREYMEVQLLPKGWT